MALISRFIDPTVPAVVLAPMEGVTDARLRQFLTRTGQYDYCVTEFIRVSETVLSEKNFRNKVEELSNQGMTQSGVPLLIQLLGGDPDKLAESAFNAASAGALGIDLNFGCPAPTVNRNDGGATLLKYPDRLENIIRTVRKRVPASIPVSAKLRLGFDDPSAIDENAKRAEQAGASWITIHGRTRTQGYTPPAYWEPIGRVRQKLSIPVIANGEIWSVDDLIRCQEQSGCIHFMIGRGSLALPTLAAQLRSHLNLPLVTVNDPHELPRSTGASDWANTFENYGADSKRIKQWARYLNSRRPIPWWDQLKIQSSREAIFSTLRTSTSLTSIK